MTDRTDGTYAAWVLALLLAAALPAAAQTRTNLPASFGTDFSEVAAVIGDPEPTPLEIGAASLRATRLFAAGAAGLGYAERQFRSAPDKGSAVLGGLYLCVHGGTQHVYAIRRELETNRTRRVWLNETVATEKHFLWSLDSGEQWKPLARVLPSTTGCRQLSLVCLASADPLVRRGGLFWGYWFPSKPYWESVKKTSAGDKDALTRRLAAVLIAREKENAE
jgi:hypothetical protein